MIVVVEAHIDGCFFTGYYKSLHESLYNYSFDVSHINFFQSAVKSSVCHDLSATVFSYFHAE